MQTGGDVRHKVRSKRQEKLNNIKINLKSNNNNKKQWRNNKNKAAAYTYVPDLMPFKTEVIKETQDNVSASGWHRVLAMFPFLCWEGSVHAGCTRTQEGSGSGHEGDHWSLLPWINPFCAQHETHALPVPRPPHPHSWEHANVLQCDGPATYQSVQCRLANTHCREHCTPHLLFAILGWGPYNGPDLDSGFGGGERWP